MNLQTRVDKLERQAGGGGCPECGYYAGAQLEIEVVLPKADEAYTPRPSEYCATCWRSLVFTIDLGSARADA